MVDSRFTRLEQALVQAGVAARHARRAVIELDSHLRRLTDQAVEQGAAEHDARIEAHRRLGTDAALIQSYCARPELLSWSRRRPMMYFALAPIALYLALSTAAVALVWGVVESLSATLHRTPLAPVVSTRIDLAVRLLCLWLIPGIVAAAFSVLAYRRRAALAWPMAGVASVCLLVALPNMSFMVTGGASLGQIDVGVGISLATLPMRLLHAAAVALFALAPACRAMRRSQRPVTAAR